MQKFNRLEPTMDWVVYDDDPIIRKRSKEITLPLNIDQIETIEKLISYVDCSYENQANKFSIREGIGMASIQLGKEYRITYLHFDQDGVEYKYLIGNPKIIKESRLKSFLSMGEGCLSVKLDYEGIVPRSAKVSVKAIDLFNNEEITIVASGFLSIALQHEIDHMNGVLFYDRINKFNIHFTDSEWEEIN